MLVRWIAVVLVVLMLVALFVGGAQPLAVGLVPAPWDKLAHAAFFFVFALLLARFASLPVALVIVLALLIGAADEIHQSFLPGRAAGWDDWLADVAGTGLGLIRFKTKGTRTDVG
jgi:VanZ family protein